MVQTPPRSWPLTPPRTTNSAPARATGAALFAQAASDAASMYFDSPSSAPAPPSASASRFALPVEIGDGEQFPPVTVFGGALQAFTPEIEDGLISRKFLTVPIFRNAHVSESATGPCESSWNHFSSARFRPSRCWPMRYESSLALTKTTTRTGSLPNISSSAILNGASKLWPTFFVLQTSHGSSGYATCAI
jgi:hypothetical protein